MKYFIITLFSLSLLAQDYDKLSCYASSQNEDTFSKLLANYENLTSYLDSKSKAHFKYRCDLSGIKNKTEYIISIDGANGFSPIDFELMRLSTNANNFKATSLIGLQKEKSNSKNDIFKKIYSENFKAYSPMSALLKEQFKRSKNHQDFLYFSHVHLGKVARCIKKIKSTNPKIKIKLLGYSWGGNTVQKLMYKFKRQKIKIDSVLLIDPVRKGFMAIGSLTNLFSLRNSNFFEKTNNVGKLYGVYQKTDTEALKVLPIRGNIVQKADKSINLSETCDGVNHLNLNKCPSLIKLYQKFLND